MNAKFRTTQIKVVDQQGRQHWLLKRSEIVDVKFPNGSTGATVGNVVYRIYGRKVIELDSGLFDADGVIYKQVSGS